MGWFSSFTFLVGQETTGGRGAAAPAAGGASTFVFLALIFVVFYFFMIRPQNKKRKQREAMIKALKKGDKVISSGGIHGIVVKVSDHTISLKVDEGAKIELSRNSIAEVEARPAPENSPSE